MKLLATLLLLVLSTHTFAQEPVSILPYLSVRGAGSPAISPDGKWILYTSSVSGTAQIWRLPAKATPDGDCYWPEQLTFFSEPVTGTHYSPDGKWICFRMDEGGNEKGQLYMMPANGGPIDTIAYNPKAIHWGGFSRYGKYIYYQSNAREEKYFDIFRMDVATRKVELLHQPSRTEGFAGVSPDNRWLLISRDSGNANDWLYIKDLTTQKPTEEPRLLTPHTAPATYSGMRISLDGKRLYFFTDQDREFANRAYIDLQDPNAKVTFRENIKWDVDQAVISVNEEIEVVTHNVDGISQLKIYDFKTGKELPGPKLPEGGFINNIEISDDASKIAFNYTSPTVIGAIFVFDRKRNVTEPITKPNFAGLDPKSFVAAKLIHYPSFDGQNIPALWYESPYAKSTKMPAIAYMHGGPEGQERPWFNSLVQYFVRRGYSVLIPNVRGSTGYGKSYASADNGVNRMTSVRDMEYANKWLAKQPTVDASRLIVYGGSYGGFMSLAAMTMQSDIWAAGVDLFGIANFHSFLKNTGAWRQQNRIAEYGDPVRDSAFLVSISPLTHVDKISKPLFVFQGKNDPRVPHTESEQIVAAVRKKGVPVEYVLLEDEGHGISKRPNRIRVYNDLVNFLDRVLK